MKPVAFTDTDRQLWRTLVARVRRHLRPSSARSNTVTLMTAAATKAARRAVLPPAWQADLSNPACELATLARNFWRLTGVDREAQRPRLAALADAVAAEIDAPSAVPAAPSRHRADVDG